jgi:hypothetical protein
MTVWLDENELVLAPPEETPPPHQCWTFARGRIQSRHTSGYLTVPSKKIGLQLSFFSFSRRQKWTYSEGGLMNRKYSRYLTASDTTMELQLVSAES